MTAKAPQPPALAQDLSSRLAAAGPLVQQDSVEAAEVLRAIVADAAEAGERGIEAEAAYLCARAEVNNGRLDPALELIDRARRQWEAEGDRLSAWRTDLGRMHVLEPTQFAKGHQVLWSHPAYANRTAFMRNDKEIVALDLTR